MERNKSLFNESLVVRDQAHQKRKKARTNVNIDGEYWLNDGKEIKVPCTITDVGTGGLSLMTRAILYEGDALTVSFRLGKNPVRLAGSVVRVNGKNVGLQFQNVDEAQIDAIQHHIHAAFFDKDTDKKRS